MRQTAAKKSWIFKQKQITVTTWKLRAVVLLAVAGVVVLTYPRWLVAIGNTLLHEEGNLSAADAILLENFDPDYTVFEAARGLVEAGYASRVLTPVRTHKTPPEPGSVEKGFVEVMSRVAEVRNCEIVPVQHIEPVSLNVARQVADFLEKEGIHSVLVVSPGFRSTRSYLVYSTVFNPRGIRVQCFAAPTAGATADGWWHTWHGVQDACLELGKLLYYRYWVL